MATATKKTEKIVLTISRDSAEQLRRIQKELAGQNTDCRRAQTDLPSSLIRQIVKKTSKLFPEIESEAAEIEKAKGLVKKVSQGSYDREKNQFVYNDTKLELINRKYQPLIADARQEVEDAKKRMYALCAQGSKEAQEYIFENFFRPAGITHWEPCAFISDWHGQLEIQAGSLRGKSETAEAEAV